MIKVFDWRSVYKPEAKPVRFLIVLALTGIAQGLYKGVQDNYLAEIAHISAFERGIVEFFRELPGLLVVFLLALMYKCTQIRVFKIGTALFLAGILGLLLCGTGKVPIVLFIVVFSFGEHINMPVRSTISLDLAKDGAGGLSLGCSNALAQAGNIVGFLIVTTVFFVFSRLGFGTAPLPAFRVVFAISAALLIGSVLVVLAMQEREQKTGRRRFYFAKKFTTYYMLEVFYGARKQIFMTFAPYALILQYGANASLMALLLAVCATFGVFLSPAIGTLIDKLGYKFVMVTDTLILIIVCLVFGFAHRIFPPHIAFIVVCVNFVLDSIISIASMASNVYVRDIADNADEVTATLSTGISVNHVISIFIALAGGLIWNTLGIETLFTLSAVLGLINSIYAATIKIKPAKRARV
jgi:MFS family permease